MRKVSLFFWAAGMLVTSGMQAAAPESLAISGTALGEYAPAEHVAMKKSDNSFELYTHLQNGDYAFSDGTAGSSITQEGEYRVRVDYSGTTPVVAAEKIKHVYLWAPWNQFTIAELSYAGKSAFHAENLLCNKREWGDDRYRIRIEFEDGTLETYASNQNSKLFLSSNKQWGKDDNGDERSYKIASKYIDTGKAFSVDVYFKTDADYTHAVSEYVDPDTPQPAPAPESLAISGSALSEYADGEQAAMKRFDSHLELYTYLQSGDYAFSDNTPGGSVTEEGVYRIRVQYTTKGSVVSCEKIEKVYMWGILNNKTIAELDYAGNAVFKAIKVTTSPDDWKADWADERRYKIRVKFADGKLDTYGPKGRANFVLLEGGGQWDNPYDLAIKFREGAPFDLTVAFPVESDYSYTIEDYVAPFPESLAMSGSALAEYAENETAPMKRIGQYYELYTALVSGDYEFSDETAGGNIDETGIYRIRVDYTQTPTAVVLQKIQQVYMWAPMAQRIVTELPYAGHATFKQEDIRWNTADWAGDDRYRIRIDFGTDKEAFTETYGPKDDENFVLIGNAQWAPSNYNYTPKGYTDTGRSFNSIVSFAATGPYDHLLEECTNPSSGFDRPQDTLVAVYPTLVNDRLTVTLPEGTFTVSIMSAAGQMYSQTNGVSGNRDINMQNLPQGVYLVQIAQNGQPLTTQRIVKL